MSSDGPSDVMIRATQLGKRYQLYASPRDRIRQLLLGTQSKRFSREVWALRDVSFEIHRGEIVGVIGRNGSGKSTLLQLIGGILKPSIGAVEVKGRVSALLELGAGFNPEFTGRENVFLNGALLGLTRAEVGKKIPEIEEFAEIGDFFDSPTKTYSSGMFVRLAFAVQACVDPDVLIVDEALAVGDVFFRQRCYGRLAELRRQGCTILLVTHGMGDVEQHCSRAIFLSEGEAAFDGPAPEAVRRYYLSQSRGRSIGTSITAPNPPLQPRSTSAAPPIPSWPITSGLQIGDQASVNARPSIQYLGMLVCDETGQPCLSFKQGDVAHFYCEFDVLEDMESPVVGVSIQSDRGIIAHGKSSLECDAVVPDRVPQNSRIRLHQAIKLDVAAGEYTVELGLGEIPTQIYAQRYSSSYDELSTHLHWLCAVSRAGNIAIVMSPAGKGLQLYFHGVADLPGACTVSCNAANDL